jgi:hypothetical protein
VRIASKKKTRNLQADIIFEATRMYDRSCTMSTKKSPYVKTGFHKHLRGLNCGVYTSLKWLNRYLQVSDRPPDGGPTLSNYELSGTTGGVPNENSRPSPKGLELD